MKAFYLTPLLFVSLALRCFGQDDDIRDHHAAAIKEDLLEMQYQQKSDAKNQYIVTMECGDNSKEVAMARRYTRWHDSIARLKVESIVHVYGYPGPKVIGKEANSTLFNIIYNMPWQMAQKYVAILWIALKNGDTTPENYATFADKVSLQESNGQIYGTITQIKSGKLYRPPLLNPSGVDSLRRIIGLPPLQVNKP